MCGNIFGVKNHLGFGMNHIWAGFSIQSGWSVPLNSQTKISTLLHGLFAPSYHKTVEGIENRFRYGLLYIMVSAAEKFDLPGKTSNMSIPAWDIWWVRTIYGRHRDPPIIAVVDVTQLGFVTCVTYRTYPDVSPYTVNINVFDRARRSSGP